MNKKIVYTILLSTVAYGGVAYGCYKSRQKDKKDETAFQAWKKINYGGDSDVWKKLGKK